MTENVRLAPPGAGLPTLERLVAKTGLVLLRSTLGRERTQAWLEAETRRVLALARALPPDQLQRPVLVPRLVGLEDSSRHWSPAMIVQHLVIVDTGIGDVIEALCAGHDFGREVRIADVKPSPAVGPEQFELLESALAAYSRRVSTIADLRTTRRHAHPWFGGLDGLGWHTLAAVHSGIHRRQLEAVIRLGLTET